MLIAFGLTILGVGFWNNTAALVVLAIPPILTNAYFGIDGIDRDVVVVDRARGQGRVQAREDTRVLRQDELVRLARARRDEQADAGRISAFLPVRGRVAHRRGRRAERARDAAEREYQSHAGA